MNKMIKNQDGIIDVEFFLQLAKLCQDTSSDLNLAMQPLIYDKEILALLENNSHIPKAFEEVTTNSVHNICVWG